ncbi:MAG: sulfotransferase [Thermomicrobiales bacterium]|nr:sulfotransferase [Thermomicrobiales bacterium]
MPEITTTYLVLATPRSGSTLLGQALNSTGVAGDPREHFGHKMEFWAQKWGTTSLPQFTARLMQERAGDNGVFGAKLLYAHLDRLLRSIAAEPTLADLPPARALDALFPDLRYLWITRDDSVRQAISYWKAKETGVWGREAPRAGRTGQGRRKIVKGGRQTGREAQFDYDGIATLQRAIQEEDAAIGRFFRDNDIAPMHVVYEAFVRAYEPTTRTVLEFLGISAPPDLHLGQPRTQKLADDRTEEWVARFQALQAAGPA